MSKKKKKEKITYIDDGRTIADMSNVGGGRRKLNNSLRPHSTAKEQWQTYLAAVKMMFVPMLVVISALIVIYMLLWLVFLLL